MSIVFATLLALGLIGVVAYGIARHRRRGSGSGGGNDGNPRQPY